jgi:glucose-1-phosphate thymidylyltransferase
MNVIILCAGFATRMYPLTENFPKSLLTVGGRPVLDYLVSQIIILPKVKNIHIVTNAKFFDHFYHWHSEREKSGAFCGMTVKIHNNGVIDNESRMGAAGDFRFVLNTIDRPGKILVSGGDNIYLFSIKPLWVKLLSSHNHHVVALAESNREKLKKTGIIEIGDNNRVLRLHEKPDLPPSTWTCPPLYFFQPSVWSMLDRFLQTSGNHDAPGHFIDYLCRQERVEAIRLEDKRLDIGSVESYHSADRQLQQKTGDQAACNPFSIAERTA